MKRYQIADLEHLTGIKAHTIRIWEKRYGLIEPHRTTTNIRYYDDEQVKKLLNVATLIAHGQKISRIAELTDQELSQLVGELKHVQSDDGVCVALINELTTSMLSFDEAAFEKVFSASITRFGIFGAMMKVFYPFLQKTGVLWSINETMPAQEHFASCIIRRKLMSSIDGLPPASQPERLFLLYLPPEEWHDTGLLLADYMIRSKGYKTIYLGQNVPYDNIETVIKKVKPTDVITFHVVRKQEEEVFEAMREMCVKNKKINFMLCGSPTMLESMEPIKGLKILKQPIELLDQL